MSSARDVLADKPFAFLVVKPDPFGDNRWKAAALERGEPEGEKWRPWSRSRSWGGG